jgi:tetratricopeptide (TPR) repeat protein
LALLTAILLGCSRSAQQDFAAGVAYFKAEKFAKAESCFARAVAGRAPTAQAFNFLGVCQLHDGKTDAAIQSFHEALKLDSDHAAAKYNLALAFLEAGKPDDAIPLLRQLPAAQAELGRAYLRVSAWGQARQVLQKSGETPDALNSLGVANAHLGNYREAKDNFEHCISVAPDFASAYLNLAIVEHRHLGDKAAAMRHYRHYLELDSKRDDVRQLVAQLEQELAPRPKPVEPTAAVPPSPPPPKPVETAKPAEQPPPPASPKPETAPAPPAPAPAPAVKRRVPVATQTLKAGNRAKAQTLFNEGIALQQQGKLTEAIASYNRAIAADPSFANAYYNLAIACRDARQPARALDNYELALLANPKFTNARINYAILLQQEGYTTDALAQYEQVLQETPNDASIHLTVATLYARDRATKDKARQHYQAFLKLSPNSPAARDIRRWLEQNP